MVLYNEWAKVLISGDALWEDDVPAMVMRIEGSTCVLNLLTSLERLGHLDVAVVYPGHGRPFSNFKGALSKSREKAREFLIHREKTGAALLKKITIYTILMHKQVEAKTFLDRIMGACWFKETIDLFFNSAYQQKYDEMMSDFLSRDIVRQERGMLMTTITP